MHNISISIISVSTTTYFDTSEAPTGSLNLVFDKATKFLQLLILLKLNKIKNTTTALFNVATQRDRTRLKGALIFVTLRHSGS
jgi:hypothetical protein